MEKDNKIQYKILKSEACGHTIEYKMVKKEHELEKARIDEGLSPREKMKAREARSPKEREPKELNPEQYETGKKIARTKAVTATGEKERKETLKDVLHTHKQNAPKSPSKEDLEYPMAASEKECLCKDCDCDKKEVKKSEKFYIQKIQELRKQMTFSPGKTQVGGGNLPAQNPTGLTPEQQKMAADNLSSITSNMGRNVAEDSAKKYQQQQKFGTLSQGPQVGSRTDSITPKTPAAQIAQQNPGRTEQLVQNIKKDPTPEQLYSSIPELKPAPAAGAPAPAPAAQKYDMKNPFKVENAKNFKDAFNQARKETGGGGNVFEYGGKKYHTHTQDEFKNPEKAGIPADNKFYKDWQAKKDVTGPGAYYANKMNPTPAAPASAQTPTAQPAAGAPTATPAAAPTAKSGRATELLNNIRQSKDAISSNENSFNPGLINPTFAEGLGVSKKMKGGKGMLQNSLTPYGTSSPDLSINPNTVIENRGIKPEDRRKKSIQPNSSASEAMAKPKNLA